VCCKAKRVLPGELLISSPRVFDKAIYSTCNRHKPTSDLKSSNLKQTAKRMEYWPLKVLTGIAFSICSLSSYGIGLGVAAANGAPDEKVVQHVLRNSAGLTADEIRLNYDRCDSTTLSMKICGAYRWAVQDIRLNRAFSRAKVVAKDSGYEQSLVRAQRAWLTYRDTQCAFEGISGAGGGTMEGLYVLSCKEELTKLQADRLEAEENQR